MATRRRKKTIKPRHTDLTRGQTAGSRRELAQRGHDQYVEHTRHGLSRLTAGQCGMARLHADRAEAARETMQINGRKVPALYRQMENELRREYTRDCARKPGEFPLPRR